MRFALATGVVVLAVSSCSGPTQTVRVINDTRQTWAICGSDCRQYMPTVTPGHDVVVQTRNGEEIFLFQHGRETGACLLPGRSESAQTIKISAKKDCVY